MPPHSSDSVPVSSLKIIPPPNRSSLQTGDHWLRDKQETDGAEALWRIHDNLYDLSDFIKRHPGGSEWIKLSKGLDITEAFEVHHLTTSHEKIIKKYFVKKATKKRNSPYTFKEDGFYKTLKSEVIPILKNLPKQSINTSAFFTDSLLVGMFMFAILANTYWNYVLAVISGMFMACLAIASHNYFHRKDNARMLYFNFTLMSYREWRISHVLSHHMHTNTIDDMEISGQEPILKFLPFENKTFYHIISWIIFPLYCSTVFHLSFIKTLIYGIRGDAYWDRFNAIPFLLPLTMYLIGGQTLVATIWMWTFIVLISSTHFFLVGFNAAHHHPDIFHDGDTPRSIDDYDWGLSQLDAVMDRNDITGSHFLVLTNFGDHGLHHLFPTLDHGTLEYLYPILKDVCQRFNVDLRITSQLELIKGAFKQLIRTRPNPNPPDLLKKYN